MSTRSLCHLTTAINLALAVACNVSDPAPSTGGVDVDPSAKLRGLAVLNTDYASTSISMLSKTGKVESVLFIASSSENPGLSTPLSGDVALPSSDAVGTELVLVDRSESVVSWVNLKTAKVRAQLNVSTGFSANPQDYLALAEDKAYVPRFAANGDAGKEDFDGGNDVLIIDPSVPEITGSIDLGELPGKADGYLPNANRIVLAGDLARVTLNGLKTDFTDILDARVVSIDPKTDKVVQTLSIDGIKNCGSMALSPDGKQLALACAGLFGQNSAGGFPDSGVVLLEVGAKLKEVARFGVKYFGDTQVNTVTYVDATHLLVTTTGTFADETTPGSNDQAVYFDIKKKKGQLVLESDGVPYTLGGAGCLADYCFLADASRDAGVVQLFKLEDGELQLQDSVHADDVTGLAPRSIARF